MKIKQIWSQAEDQYLKLLVQEGKNQCNWNSLAQKINAKFSDKTRSVKQCQQRCINYLSGNHNSHISNDWSEQQTQALFYFFQIWGSRWTKISQEIKGKSENSVKNRFYGSLRKALRKMNRAAKTLVKKFKKEVKYQSITRIIDASEGLFRLQSPLKQQSQTLTKKILCLAKKSQEQMPSEQAEELIIQINKFNMATRSYKSKKKIKNEGPSQISNFKQTCFTKKQTCCYSSKQNSQDFEQVQEEKKIISNEMENAVVCEQNQIKVQDGLIDFMFEDKRPQKIYKNQILDLDFLLSQLQSPLECEAWI